MTLLRTTARGQRGRKVGAARRTVTKRGGFGFFSPILFLSKVSKAKRRRRR